MLCLVAQSCVRLSGTPWAVARQAPLSMELSGQEYWSGLPCSPQGIFPTQGLNPGLRHCRQILYHLSHQGSPINSLIRPKYMKYVCYKLEYSSLLRVIDGYPKVTSLSRSGP